MLRREWSAGPFPRSGDRAARPESATAPITAGDAGLTAGTYRLGLAAITLTAALLQLGLFHAGLERLSADESARALLAHGLTWGNALEPFIWPPFTKLASGLVMQVWDDSFVVPRLVSNLAGLLALLAVAALATALFRDRRISLVAAALAVVEPSRLLFSVVPLSDIHYMLFLLLAALFVLRWLRGGGTRALLVGCAAILLAETVRYEATVFALCLGLVVAWRWWRGTVGTAVLFGAALLLAGFPVFWAVNTLVWYGSLEILGNAGAQYRAAYGENWRFALAWLPMARPMLLDLAWSPALLLGLWTLAAGLRRDPALRGFAVVFGLPLPLTSLLMLATLSLPLAVTWRSFAVWALLLVPFAARGMVRLAAALVPRLRPLPVLPLLLAAALVLPMVRSTWLAWRDGIVDPASGEWRAERRAGLALRAMLEREGGRALVDAWDNVVFLDIIAGSGRPELFVTSAGEDPAWVAGFLYLRHVAPRPEEAAIRARALADRFALASGGDAAALAAAGVRWLVIREPALRAALDASPLVERRAAAWPGWTLYRVGPAVAGG